MASDLDKLIAESEEAIKRLDAIQKQRHNTPLLQRIKNHFSKNSAHFTNVLLAGSCLAVALGRLAQKQDHQVRPASEGRSRQGRGQRVEGGASAAAPPPLPLRRRLLPASVRNGPESLPLLDLPPHTHC